MKSLQLQGSGELKAVRAWTTSRLAWFVLDQLALVHHLPIASNMPGLDDGRCCGVPREIIGEESLVHEKDDEHEDYTIHAM